MIDKDSRIIKQKIRRFVRNMNPNYDRLAPFYSLVSGLVFFGQIQSANKRFIENILSGSSVLIIGGGTGDILPDLPKDCEVAYVELSEKMIALAKQKSCKANVSFYQQDFSDFDHSTQFDFILCPFFLDQFGEDELTKILAKIRSLSKPAGNVLISDFYPPKKPWKLVKNTLLQLTITFINATTGLNIKHIQDIQKFASSKKLKQHASQNYFFGMIFSSWWISDGH